LAFLLGNLRLLALNWSLFWPVVLILFGAWLIWRGARPPGQFGDEAISWGLGDYRPDLKGKQVQRAEFSHGLGDFDLDLQQAVIPEGENFVRVSHGLGDLAIVIPRDVPVRVKASAGLGNVFVLGKRSEGFGPQVNFQSDDYAAAARKLSIDASVGLGDVHVMRAG
jgi:predicted membrane protein